MSDQPESAVSTDAEAPEAAPLEAYASELADRNDLEIIKPARPLRLEGDGYFSRFEDGYCQPT